MQQILFFCLLVISTNLYSQTYGDREKYLIDSVDLDKLSAIDKTLLDSNIRLFQEEKNDTIAIEYISEIVNYTTDYALAERYNSFMARYAMVKKNDPKMSHDEMRYFYKMRALSYSNYGFFADSKGDLVKALDNYYEALEIYNQIDYGLGRAIIHINIGNVYRILGSTDRSLKMVLKGIEILDNIPNVEELKLVAFSNISVIYSDNEEYEKALFYNEEALKISGGSDNLFGIAITKYNIASNNLDLGNLDKVMPSLLDAEEVFLTYDSKNWLSSIYQKNGKLIPETRGFIKRPKICGLSF